jgi:anti-sigma B factor antagonist
MTSSPSSPPSSGAGGALTVSVSEDGNTLTVTVAGELDVSTVPAFNKRLSELRHKGFHSIVLDLSAISFMDSTGLSAVLVAEMHARMRGQRFRVVEGPPHVDELFRLTGVDNFLEIVSRPDSK